eukprot:1016009-Prymnesium_polylepis.1
MSKVVNRPRTRRIDFADPTPTLKSPWALALAPGSGALWLFAPRLLCPRAPLMSRIIETDLGRDGSRLATQQAPRPRLRCYHATGAAAV